MYLYLFGKQAIDFMIFVVNIKERVICIYSILCKVAYTVLIYEKHNCVQDINNWFSHQAYIQAVTPVQGI